MRELNPGELEQVSGAFSKVGDSPEIRDAGRQYRQNLLRSLRERLLGGRPTPFPKR